MLLSPIALSISLFTLSPICHKFILLHLTSSLLLELPINHCCCLTLSIFPETQGGCCRNWVRHNLQGSRAWLVMILLGNVAISTQWEIGGMGRRAWLGVCVGGACTWCDTQEKLANDTILSLPINHRTRACASEWVRVCVWDYGQVYG